MKKLSHRVGKVTFKVGDDVVVVGRADPTLPESYLGRKGRIVEFPAYQEVGDDPDEDPFILVEHAASKDLEAGTQFYWSEEIAPVPTPKAQR
jgi:hypothetical protein